MPFVKKSEKSMAYVALYMYDNLIVGHVKAIKKAIAFLQEMV